MLKIKAVSLVLFFLCALCVSAVILPGCDTTRTVLVRPGDPVRLAEPVRARVYVNVGGQWQRTDERIQLPEGWYCLPDPGK